MAQKQRNRPNPANYADSGSIDSKISAVADMSVSQLRKSWEAEFPSAMPPIRSRAVLRHLLAWQIQSNAIGNLDSVTERALTKIAKALQQDGSYEPKIRGGFSPGIVLSREWKGVIHRATVATEGFEYLGKNHRSLSEIARTITGTRWSGPRFFGLEQKTAPASREAAR